MKHFKTIIGLSIIIFFGASLFSQASGYDKLGKNRAQNVEKRNFSIEKTRIIEGKIMKIEKATTGQYGAPGIHLVVNSGKEAFNVHMGPEYFFNKKGVTFKIGDTIKMSAFEGSFKDQVTFYASSMEVAGNVTLIRNKNGDPEWRRSNRYGTGRSRGKGTRSYRGYRNR